MSSTVRYRYLLSALMVFALLAPATALQQNRGAAPPPSSAVTQQPAGALPAGEEPILRFGILGDTGTGDSPQYQIGQKLAARRGAFPFDVVVMLGDNMYGGQGAKDFRNKFEEPYQPLLSGGVRFFASLGNHDKPERQILYKPFNMGGERYYSFSPRPGVRFFALDSNYMDRRQLEWLDAALRDAGTDWKFPFFHHPLYSSGEKHGPSLELRRVLEPLFLKHKVDVVLSGHEHFYERIRPQKGIQYFILGNSAKLREDGIISGSAITAKGFDTDNAFMTAEVSKNEINFQTFSRTGAMIDSVKVRRGGNQSE